MQHANMRMTLTLYRFGRASLAPRQACVTAFGEHSLAPYADGVTQRAAHEMNMQRMPVP